jgi:acyl carrier protein
MMGSSEQSALDVARPPPASLDEIKALLRALVEECTGIPGSAIEDESTLEEGLAFDSMSFITLQVTVEERLGVYCELEQLLELDRFDAIARYIFEATRAAETTAAPTPAMNGGDGL